MRRARDLLALVTIGLSRLAIAQLVQQNATICNWAQLRAGVIRDVAYIDGGEMWTSIGFTDGTTHLVTNNGNVQGDMYFLNFSDPFDTTKTNLTALFEPKEKAGGAANNIAPNYVDGFMFTNDDELFLYAGLLRLTDAYSPPEADAVLGYEAYQYGAPRQTWEPGFIQDELTPGVTRYITNGAGVSVHSENLGFYFSGMRGVNWGPIYENDDSANVTANTLIEVDMSTMRAEKWSNNTFPDNISQRANAELVWIPVSMQGVLIAIGGVDPPEEIFATGLNSSQTAESQSESPGFMTSLPVYDISSSTWYMQNTTGTPPGQLTEFCSVVAAANDSSSFNIYIYGGYDGLASEDSPSDDVWILSIPSFIWIKAYSGQASHGRSGHTCLKPYPDQMFVIGGLHEDPTQCVEGGIIQIFNLNTLKFQDTYDPSVWSNYEVPSVVTAAIGGNAQGGSTTAASWSESGLADLFTSKYTKTIMTYYPYAAANTSTPTPVTPLPVPHAGLAKWVAPVLGVVLGLIVICIVIVIILLFRRRKRRTSVEDSSLSGGSSSNRVMRWVIGMPNVADHKPEPSVTSSEVDETSVSSPVNGVAEVGGQQRYEMQAVEKPKPLVELATPYNFQDRPNYPRSIDYAYGSGPASQPPPLRTNNSQSRYSQRSAEGSAPSPYLHSNSTGDVGQSALPDTSSMGESSPAASSPQPSHSEPLPPQHPPTSYPFHTHVRTISSTSSGVAELPTPSAPISPEEEQRQSRFLANLPNSPASRNASGFISPLAHSPLAGSPLAETTPATKTPAEEEEQHIVSPTTPNVSGIGLMTTQMNRTRPRAAARKSSFGEMFDHTSNQRKK